MREMREIIESVYPTAKRRAISASIHKASAESPSALLICALPIVPCPDWHLACLYFVLCASIQNSQVRDEFADHEGKLDFPNYLDAILWVDEYMAGADGSGRVPDAGKDTQGEGRPSGLRRRTIGERSKSSKEFSISRMMRSVGRSPGRKSKQPSSTASSVSINVEQPSAVAESEWT